MTKRTGVYYPNFTCRRAANGGWLLEYDGVHGAVTSVLGAFTSPADLIHHLASHVTENGLEEVTPPARDQEGGAA